jgi:hypothetical protein
MDAYLQYRKRLDTNQPSAAAATLVPSGDSNFASGLAGRLAALTGINPQNPDQLPPPQEDNAPPAFYRDLARLWTLQRLR